MNSNLNITNNKADSKDNAHTETLKSNEINKSADNTIISSSYEYANKITKAASTTNLASLDTEIPNEESLVIFNNKEIYAKDTDPEHKK